MKILIIICMHGKLAIEILKTIELIIGKQSNTFAIKFLTGENTDNIINKYKKCIKKSNIKKIIFFVDILGGSPFNAANNILNTNKKIKGEIISGTNIPMLLEVFMCIKENNKIYKLVNIAIKSGKKGINSTTFNIKKKDTNNMKIMLTRIDDRLIHGQVCTGWSKELKISRIIVINDKIYKDPIRVKLLKQVSPPSINSHVVNINKFIKVYNNPKYKNDKVLLLFTNPKDILKTIKKGLIIKSINIGGMSYKEGKIQITDAISVNKKDIKSFYDLNKMNIELEIRKVPNNKKINLINILNNIKN